MSFSCSIGKVHCSLIWSCETGSMNFANIKTQNITILIYLEVILTFIRNHTCQKQWIITLGAIRKWLHTMNDPLLTLSHIHTFIVKGRVGNTGIEFFILLWKPWIITVIIMWYDSLQNNNDWNYRIYCFFQLLTFLGGMGGWVSFEFDWSFFLKCFSPFCQCYSWKKLKYKIIVKAAHT